MASIASVGFLCVLFFRGGPYIVPNSYAKHSLLKSVWGVRPLAPSFQEKQHAVEKGKEASGEADTNRELLALCEQQAVSDVEMRQQRMRSNAASPDLSVKFNDEEAFNNSVRKGKNNRQSRPDNRLNLARER